MRIRKWIQPFLAALPVLFVSTVAYAACSNSTGGGLNNPLSFCTIQDFVAGALKVLVMIALPIIGFFIVFVGFQFIAAQGNDGKLTTAKKNFVYVIIGAALVLGAWVLSTLLGATVSQLVG